MADYTLYYWPIPFRGQFVRAVLGWAGATWDEAGPDETARVKDLPLDDQPVPAMAPPMLTDHGADVSLAQLPAILAYLGEKYRLIPDDPARAALTHKIVADANDTLDEITRYGGRIAMWDADAWDAFRPRLRRRMQIFEATGRRHGLSEAGGTMLGTDADGLADIVTAVLWGTMTHKLPALRQMLADAAPAVTLLTDRLMATPALEGVQKRTDAAYGAVYCGGQIEASLRKVLEPED